MAQEVTEPAVTLACPELTAVQVVQAAEEALAARVATVVKAAQEVPPRLAQMATAVPAATVATQVQAGLVVPVPTGQPAVMVATALTA